MTSPHPRAIPPPASDRQLTLPDVIAPRRAPAREQRPITRWIAAFNNRDLDTILAYTHPDIDLQPLRLPAMRPVYRGHDGVRAWFQCVRASHHEHQIEIDNMVHTHNGQLLAVGTITHRPTAQANPFCALHTLADGLIIAAHHHLSDPDTLLTPAAPSPDHRQKVPHPENNRRPRCGEGDSLQSLDGLLACPPAADPHKTRPAACRHELASTRLPSP